MENLNEIKIRKEIELLDQEIKIKNKEGFYSTLRLLISVIGAAALFFLITQPESILNRKSSNETINRERARLLIDIIKEEDPSIRKRSLEILVVTYPSDEGDWLQNIEEQLIYEASEEIRKKKVKTLIELKTARDELEYQVSQGSLNDLEKRIARQNLHLYNVDIEKIEEELDKNK